jgi:hypothetical protein
MSPKEASDRLGEPVGWELESFMIIGLHGRQSVRLEFAGRYSVFIADNGAGKTTALFILQCVLNDNWRKTLRYDFRSLILQFSGGLVFSIERQEISEAPLGGWFHGAVEKAALTGIEVRTLIHLAHREPFERARVDPLFRRLWRTSGFPSMRVYRHLLRLEADAEEGSLFDTFHSGDMARLRHFLRSEFRHAVIYLPTYRRVEQELRTLLEKEDPQDTFGGTIRFGMRDVDLRIEAISKKIRDHFVITYSRISGQMLRQLSRTTEISDTALSRLSVRRDVEIVLTRLSDYVSAEDRRHILELYDSGELHNNLYLSSFLSSLIASYEDVRHLEHALQSFGEKCNQYLIRKEFKYESAAASLKLHEKGSLSKPLDLNTLSSGEKQIVGVLSQVYLGEESSYIVIFDEPELSLSVEWQRNILPDIVHSEKCHALIAATHSPFIFENELDECARSLISLDYAVTAHEESDG